MSYRGVFFQKESDELLYNDSSRSLFFFKTVPKIIIFILNYFLIENTNLF